MCEWELLPEISAALDSELAAGTRRRHDYVLTSRVDATTYVTSPISPVLTIKWPSLFCGMLNRHHRMQRCINGVSVNVITGISGRISRREANDYYMDLFRLSCSPTVLPPEIPRFLRTWVEIDQPQSWLKHSARSYVLCTAVTSWVFTLPSRLEPWHGLQGCLSFL
jgi:hypothetical protein